MSNFKQKLLDFNISSRLAIWWIIPAVVLIIAIIVFASISGVTGSTIDGFGLGIDFTGGTEMTVYVADTDANEKTITNIVQGYSKNAPRIDYIQGVSTGGQTGIRIQYKNTLQDSTQMKELNDGIQAKLSKEFGGATVDYTNRSSTASKDLIKKALIATVVALALILVYIIIRFEWLSGVSAIIALLHDVLIMICLTVICRIPINSSFIAAIITIVSYSINNTIVVFDRVRERKKSIDKKTIVYNDVSNEAIVATFNRTLFTSATTLIMVIILSILGVASMRNFTLPIMFGLLAGTYSSMFLAAPTWASMNNSILRNRAKQLAKYKAQK